MPRLVPLNGGRVTIPVIGFGAGTAWFKRGPSTGGSAEPELDTRLVESVKTALEVGFRHLDLAEMYGTDKEVSIALKETHIPRKDIFITHKLLKSLPDVRGATLKIMEHLEIKYLDLLLIHSPFLPANASLEQCWREMESLVDDGLVRCIGVSNFQRHDLEQLLAFARHRPVVNQVEFHPYLQQPELHEYCKLQGIVMCGYSGLLSLSRKVGGPLDPVVKAIATTRGTTPSTILTMWSLQKEAVIITTSGQKERLQEYISTAQLVAAGIECLSAEEIAAIDEAGSKLDWRHYWQKDFGFTP